MTTEQPTQASNNPLKRAVDLSHRFDGVQQDESFDIVDSISLMTERALGVLHSIIIQFEASSDSARISDRLMSGAISAAIQEIEDIDAVIRAFAELDSAKKKVQA